MGKTNDAWDAGRRHLLLNTLPCMGVAQGGRDGAALDHHIAPGIVSNLFMFRRVIQEAHPMSVMVPLTTLERVGQ